MSAKGVQGQNKKKRVQFSEQLGEEEEPSADALWKAARKRHKLETEDQQERQVGEASVKVDHESKHTLESDEEEDEKYEKLNVEDVEGQEEGTIEFDDNIKITPFNMREEMEEGHFDSQGSFIFDKDKADIKDAWLDNINWSDVKKVAGKHWHQEQAENEDAQTSVETPNRRQMYEEILKLLKPGETVTKAIRRLGGDKSTAAKRKDRWAEKKARPESKEVDSENPQLLQLTALVDRLVSEGDFEAYGFTYEKFQHEFEQLIKRESQKSQSTAAAADDLDIFAEDISEEKLKKVQQQKDDAAATESSSNEINWFFKWKNEDSADTFGPFNSIQMQKWAEEEYFKDGVWVRRADQPDQPFYSSKRIDFELYA